MDFNHAERAATGALTPNEHANMLLEIYEKEYQELEPPDVLEIQDEELGITYYANLNQSYTPCAQCHYYFPSNSKPLRSIDESTELALQVNEIGTFSEENNISPAVLSPHIKRLLLISLSSDRFFANEVDVSAEKRFTPWKHLTMIRGRLCEFCHNTTKRAIEEFWDNYGPPEIKGVAEDE